MRLHNQHIGAPANVLCLAKHVQLVGIDTKNMTAGTYHARLQWIEEHHREKEGLLKPL